MGSIPEYWRTRGQRLRMEGSNCPACGIKHFPPRIVCPDCGVDASRFRPSTELTDIVKDRNSGDINNNGQKN